MPVNNYKGVSFKTHYATAYPFPDVFTPQLPINIRMRRDFIAAQTRLPLHDLR
jgi:hypothetical protein